MKHMGEFDGSQRSKELDGSRRSSLSASVRLDGLVVLNRRTPQSSKMKGGMDEMKQDNNNTVTVNGHGASKGDRLYRFSAVQQQNGVQGNHPNVSNQRNITDQWRRDSLGRSNRSVGINRSTRSTDSTKTSDTKEPPSNGSTAAHRNVDRSNRQTVTFDTKEMPSNGIKTTVHPHGRLIPDDDSSPNATLSQEVIPDDECPIRTTSNVQSEAATTTSTTTLSNDSTRKEENIPTPTLADSPTYLNLSTSLQSPKRASGGSLSERTVRTGSRNRKASQEPRPNKKSSPSAASFSSKLEIDNSLVLNHMHSTDSTLQKDIDESESSHDVHSLTRNGNEAESERSPSFLPSILEMEEKVLTGGSLGGTIDSRLTANALQGMMKHTNEVKKFYQPTIQLSDTKKLKHRRREELRDITVGWRKLPEPFKFKSQKEKERMKREKEQREIKKRVNRARIYTANIYQPLSVTFPVLTESKEVFIRCRKWAGDRRTEVEVTTKNLYRIATLSYTQLTPYEVEHKMVTGRRVLRDADGNQCALIFHTMNAFGKSIFRICGPVPMNRYHKSIDGYFVWAEVKNIGEMSPHFRMVLKGGGDPQGQSAIVKTKKIGSQLLRCFGTKTNGFSLYREKEDGSNLGVCGRISYYSECRGLIVSAEMDFGLMLCFALVVDEMMENRTR